ncbi:MAG: UDP-N-acetylmuramate:L-alanyl-gamma-D-glutamyl-meso-diaminopimelate ligase [Deltaproteobacteria bacterium]|nr:UDP-N-acetylmuramate:L-alanyl-gamma-D-glutamyl-meso-diaminopimelate ligase [Deltaproteobacteria bacterium]
MLYYFLGICGVAMAPAAVMIKKKGHKVLGSDHNAYPPASEWLQQEGVEVREGYRAENIPETVDRVVIGNALSRGNPEVEAVLNRRLHYISLPELLREEMIRGRLSSVITGTHGKTTTTSLLAWMLECAGRRPGFFVGGIPHNFGFGCQHGEGNTVVLEGDEYDTAFFDKRPKFLHYLPDLVILNNIEFDHADIYNCLDEIVLAFRGLLRLVPSSGLLVANSEDPIVMGLVAEASCPVVTFGEGPGAQWRFTDMVSDTQGTYFRIRREGRDLGKFRISLWGRHNVMNAMAAAAAAHWLDLTPAETHRGMETFRGIKRRMELKGVVGGIRVYDDFAHHPGAVRATLGAVRGSHPTGNIWAVFEPRSNTTRRNIFRHGLAQALALADGVVLGSVYRPEVIPPAERLDPKALVQEISARNGCPAAYKSNAEEIIEYLVPRLKKGDIVVIMSNGSFDGLPTKLIESLERSCPAIKR